MYNVSGARGDGFASLFRAHQGALAGHHYIESADFQWILRWNSWWKSWCTSQLWAQRSCTLVTSEARCVWCVPHTSTAIREPPGSKCGTLSVRGLAKEQKWVMHSSDYFENIDSSLPIRISNQFKSYIIRARKAFPESTWWTLCR